MFYLIDLTRDEIDHINESKNRKQRTQRINKCLKINSTTNPIFRLLEDEYPHNKFKRCAFCSSISNFGFKYVIIENKLYLDNIEYNTDALICSRKDTTATKDCEYKKLNPNSIEYVSKAYNLSISEAHEKILTRNKSPFYKHNHLSDEEYRKFQSRSKEYFTDKYGESKGEEIYKDIISKQNQARSVQGFIDKYGEVEGTEKYEKYRRAHDNTSLNYFTKKYGEFQGLLRFNDKNFRCGHGLDSYKYRYKDVELAQKKYNEFHKKHVYTKTLKGKIEKYGEETGRRLHLKYLNNSNYGKASKESLTRLFNKLIEFIENLPIKIPYYVGIDSNNEYVIYDEVNNSFFLYDFCLPNLGIIIEYHGSNWHYNENFDYTNRHKNLPSVQDMKEKDELKRNLASQSGFDYIEVFDTDNIEQELRDIEYLILQRIDK